MGNVKGLILSAVVIIVGSALIWVVGRSLLRPVKRLYYFGKNLFRGKYFHDNYVDENGHLVIIYKTDFGLRFWTFMGRCYKTVMLLIPLFFIMVRLDGTKGYTLLDTNCSIGDTVTVFDASEFCLKSGVLIENSDRLIIENNAEEYDIPGFVIGKYYKEPLTVVGVPGLFVRSVVSNIRVTLQLADKYLF